MTELDDRSLLLVVNDDEAYGIDLGCVQEIRAYQPLTRLPHAPCYVAGIMTVNGQIVSVVDVRQRLWGIPTCAGSRHIIVIIKHGDRCCGLLVDRAREIALFAEKEIEAMPMQSKQCFFKGLTHFMEWEKPDLAVAILDIEAIASFSLETPDLDLGHKEISYV